MPKYPILIVLCYFNVNIFQFIHTQGNLTYDPIFHRIACMYAYFYL